MLKLTINFGVVNIPIKLEAAAREDKIELHMMDKHGGRCTTKMFDSKGAEIQKSETRRGYEMAKGAPLVEIPEAELDALDPISDKKISIDAFVPAESVDALHFDKSNYLTPEDVSIQAYGLLVSALRESGKVAIGTAVLYGSKRLVCIRAGQYGLILHVCFFKSELNATKQYRPDLSGLSEKYKATTLQLIEAMSLPAFDADQYRDEYTERLRALIDAKTKGVDPAAGVVAALPPVIDIMAAMEQSLAELRGRQTIKAIVEADNKPEPARRKRKERAA